MANAAQRGDEITRIYQPENVAIKVGNIEVSGSVPLGWSVKIDGQEQKHCRHLLIELHYDAAPQVTLTQVIV